MFCFIQNVPVKNSGIFHITENENRNRNNTHGKTWKSNIFPFCFIFLALTLTILLSSRSYVSKVIYNEKSRDSTLTRSKLNKKYPIILRKYLNSILEKLKFTSLERIMKKQCMCCRKKMRYRARGRERR